MRQRYEFRVSGQLSDRARHAVVDFSDVRIVPAPPETIIYGAVTDQSHLRGIMNLLENLGLQIVSVHQLPTESNDPGEVGT